MTYIKESYHSNMTLAEAEKLLLQVLKNVMEEKISNDNVEIAVVKVGERKLITRQKEEIESMLGQLS